MLTTMPSISCFFFFNDTATTEIYTLSLHDALPILKPCLPARLRNRERRIHLAPAPFVEDLKRLREAFPEGAVPVADGELLLRSEEHTSELQSRQYLVCRLLLEKKKNIIQIVT